MEISPQRKFVFLKPRKARVNVLQKHNLCRMTLFAPTDNPTNQVFYNEQKSSLRDRRNETTTANTVVMRANRLWNSTSFPGIKERSPEMFRFS